MDKIVRFEKNWTMDKIEKNWVKWTSGSGQDCYVKYLPAGTHSLDNDSALYFFEAPIGP